jgi:phenylalanyl-tRNA synthetase beta chain
MKYMYNWLKNLLGIESTLKEQSQQFAGVVVGKILEIAKHPNADRLQIAIVQTHCNASVQKLQIVCGAKNIEVGQNVPVATVGTKMPNGLEIKEAEIRGEKSFGMLCAKDELGLGEDHSGIFILDEKAKIGMSFAEYINLKK